LAVAGHLAILFRIDLHGAGRACDQAFLRDHLHRGIGILVDHRLPETGLEVGD